MQCRTLHEGSDALEELHILLSLHLLPLRKCLELCSRDAKHRLKLFVRKIRLKEQKKDKTVRQRIEVNMKKHKTPYFRETYLSLRGIDACRKLLSSDELVVGNSLAGGKTDGLDGLCRFGLGLGLGRRLRLKER